MIQNDWTLLEIVGKDCYEGFKFNWHKLAKNGWKWLEIAELDCKLMEMDGNCWKWFFQNILF